MARLAGWTTNGCDRNNDGYIDYQDFLEMRQTTQQQLDDWIQNCWNPKASCGDINADGAVDQEDLDQKQDTENQKLHDWAVDCGFQKKGRIKR